jgi:DNA-binding FadR family transcriptional regulator
VRTGYTVEEPAYRLVANELRRRILAGEIVPGERLPVEVELADSFGVSRSTLREALRTLSSQHLVHTSRGVTGGTFVAQPAPALIASSLATGLGFLSGTEELTVADLLEARELLEVPAASLAAHRRTDAQLEGLMAVTSSAANTDRGPIFESNRSFHALVLQASNNRLLEVMTRPVFEVLQTRFLRDQAPASFWKRVNREHRAITEAIGEGNADRAAAEMKTHLEHLRQTYQRIDRRRIDR